MRVRMVALAVIAAIAVLVTFNMIPDPYTDFHFALTCFLGS